MHWARDEQDVLAEAKAWSKATNRLQGILEESKW